MSVDTMLAGDVETGKAILRDYIKATIGFEALGADRNPTESLIRMFGRVAIRKRATCSACWDICKSGQALHCMLPLSRTALNLASGDMSDDFDIIRGSGNVFRDLGHSDADREQQRALN